MNPVLLPTLLLAFATPPGPAVSESRRAEESSGAVELGEVVVTGARAERRLADAVVTTEVMTAAEIRASGARNLAELLEERPAVELERNAAGTSARLQGLDAQHVLVLVDGEPLVGRFRGALDLERVSLADVARVEVVRGPSSALYGADALGGVIHVITRTASRPLEAEGTVAGGQHGRFDLGARAGFAAGAFTGDASAHWGRADAVDLDPSDEASSVAAFDTITAGARLGVALGARTALRLRGDYALRDQTAVDVGATGAVFDRQLRVQTGQVGVGATVRLWGEPDDARAVLDVRVGLTRYVEDFVNDQRGGTALDDDQRTTHDAARLDGRVDLRLHADHQLLVGVDGLLESLDSPRLDGLRSRLRGAVYAQHEWTVYAGDTERGRAHRTAVSTGVRVDGDSQFGAAASPKLSVRYDPHATVSLRAGVGMGFRAPSFTELHLRFENPGVGYVVTGNPELRPETSVGANLSVEWRPLASLSFELAGHWNDLDDLIAVARGETATDGGTAYRYENVARAWTAGADLTASWRIVRGLRLSLGYSFLETRDASRDRPLERRAAHRGTAQLRWNGGPFDATVRAAVTGPTRVYEDDDGDGVETSRLTDPYATVDARIAFDVVRDHLRLFVAGENLLDAGDPVDLPIAPLTLTAGLSGTY